MAVQHSDDEIIRDGYDYNDAIIDAADEVLDMGRLHGCEGERELVRFTARLLSKVLAKDADEVREDISFMVDFKHDRRREQRGDR